MVSCGRSVPEGITQEIRCNILEHVVDRKLRSLQRLYRAFSSFLSVLEASVYK